MTRWRVAGGLLGLVVLSFLLRSTAIHGRYWIDEGLSVGIAKHDLLDIPGLLREDGSPPLYYLLLGVWIRIVGDGEARTHALSLAFALLTIPAAWACARALFSERAAWFTAVIAALVPFLSYYAQETRMYTLVVLLSMLFGAAYGLVFVQGRRRWLAGLVLAGTALIYTHNWGLFLVAASGLVLLPRLRRGAVAWRDALIGYGGIALLYLPWVPTVLYQARHTGAPWSISPNLFDLPGALGDLVGGSGPGVAILLAGGSGLLALWALRREPVGPRTQQAATASLLGTTLLLTIAIAFIASQISPGWTLRYFAALIGPFLLFVGGVLSRAGNLGLITVALLAGLWLHPPTTRVNNKSNVHHISVLISSHVAKGDIVVSTHPEQVPVAHFYFPPGLRWADGRGWVKDTGIMDWRDALKDYRHAKPRRVENTLVRALKPGQQLVLMLPIIRTATWNAPWTKLVKRRSKQWEKVLNADPRVTREAAVPHLGTSKLPHGVRIVLYSREAR
jgi:hypothetical protein